jgi:hypothetical protein
MIRTVFENLLLFLLPTLLYVAWVLFERSRTKTSADDDDADELRSMSHVLDDAPLLWLFVSGALLVIVTLTFFGTSSGGKPGQHYEPGIFRDGKIQPGQIE